MTPEIFTKDWFDGRTIDAISADDSKRIGWEDEITNYSEFLFNQNYIDRLINDKELIIEELNKVLEAMNVDANVGFSNKANTAYTDGSNIVIDTKFVPDNRIKNINKIYSKFDVLIGLLIHEACHILILSTAKRIVIFLIQSFIQFITFLRTNALKEILDLDFQDIQISSRRSNLNCSNDK